MSKYKDLITSYLRIQKDFWKEQFENRKLYNKLDTPIDHLYDLVHKSASPVFVLSTGRCGTKLLSEILAKDKTNLVAHQPFPELTHHGAYAYRYRNERFEEIKMMVDACRYEFIRNAWILGKRYIETNNRISYFGGQLAELYPKSKFIHLQRDLIGFVTSGYSRNYYAFERLHDEGRIKPHSPTVKPWDQFSQLEKITWLWKETNRFICESLQSVPKERQYFISSKDLYADPQKVMDLLRFSEVKNITLNQVEKLQQRPINAQPSSKKKKLTPEQVQELIDFEKSLV